MAENPHLQRLKQEVPPFLAAHISPNLFQPGYGEALEVRIEELIDQKIIEVDLMVDHKAKQAYVMELLEKIAVQGPPSTWLECQVAQQIAPPDTESADSGAKDYDLAALRSALAPFLAAKLSDNLTDGNHADELGVAIARLVREKIQEDGLDVPQQAILTLVDTMCRGMNATVPAATAITEGEQALADLDPGLRRDLLFHMATTADPDTMASGDASKMASALMNALKVKVTSDELDLSPEQMQALVKEASAGQGMEFQL